MGWRFPDDTQKVEVLYFTFCQVTQWLACCTLKTKLRNLFLISMVSVFTPQLTAWLFNEASVLITQG